MCISDFNFEMKSIFKFSWTKNYLVGQLFGYLIGIEVLVSYLIELWEYQYYMITL